MRLDWTVKALLALAVLFLGMIALRPLLQPAPVMAQTDEAHRFYVEPGVTLLRKPDGLSQVYGKMFVDMRTGDIWGFPTTDSQSPYPVNPTNSAPPKSHPMYLGKFLLSEAVLKQ
jgi:hypothetical protein